jgi:hypothetical protein
MSNAGHPPPPPPPTPPIPPNGSPEPVVAGAERARIKPPWLALAVMSLVLLGAGIGVLLIGMSSRSDAESDRDTKRELLVAQRRATREAEQEAQQRRAQAAEVAGAADVVLDLAAQISQKNDQVISAHEEAVNSFANPDPAAFNAARDRANVLVDEFNRLVEQANAANEVLTQRITALRGGVT